MARSDSQTVRTTAYTHSEADHLVYGRRNALGGQLNSATVPSRNPEKARKALRVSANDEPEVTMMGYMTRQKRIAIAKKQRKKEARSKGKVKGKTARWRKPEPPRIGSAAADWSRWPVGTTFRVVSTGQIYRVDDYGWALAGRNTIDLYMASRGDMNRWGVRHEPIQIIKWGDPQQSLAVLRGRQDYRHVRRMVLQLEGQHDAAAALR